MASRFHHQRHSVANPGQLPCCLRLVAASTCHCALYNSAGTLASLVTWAGGWARTDIIHAHSLSCPNPSIRAHTCTHTCVLAGERENALFQHNLLPAANIHRPLLTVFHYVQLRLLSLFHHPPFLTQLAGPSIQPRFMGLTSVRL